MGIYSDGSPRLLRRQSSAVAQPCMVRAISSQTMQPKPRLRFVRPAGDQLRAGGLFTSSPGLVNGTVCRNSNKPPVGVQDILRVWDLFPWPRLHSLELAGVLAGFRLRWMALSKAGKFLRFSRRDGLSGVDSPVPSASPARSRRSVPGRCSRNRVWMSYPPDGWLLH